MSFGAYEEAAHELMHEELSQDPGSWKAHRNLAMRLTMSQCGLVLSEVPKIIALDVRVRADAKVEIQAPGNRRVAQRRLVGNERFASVLEQWIAVRATLSVQGIHSAGRMSRALGATDGLFVSAPAGRTAVADVDRQKAAAAVGPCIGISATETLIAQCVARASTKIGVALPSAGARMVRIAFATSLLAQGCPEAELLVRLGLRSDFTLAAIKADLAGQAQEKAKANAAEKSAN